MSMALLQMFPDVIGSRNFKMAVLPVLVSAILNLPTSGYIGQYRHQCHSVSGPRKHRLCRWNFDASLSRSLDICTSGLAAAILNFLLSVTLDSIGTCAIRFLDPENIGFAVSNSMLYCIEAEI